jgi:hypothetical protein
MEQTVINNDEYKLKVKKNWVPATEVWHIEFESKSIYDYRFECFLTDFELQKFKDAL